MYPAFVWYGSAIESLSELIARSEYLGLSTMLPQMLEVQLLLPASEAMLFAGFIGAFLVYKVDELFWPPPGLPRLPIEVTWVNTFVPLGSAVTMHRAVQAIRRNRRQRLLLWLGVTALLGNTFLLVQGSEWVRLVAHGLNLSTDTYGATFYTLIGLHVSRAVRGYLVAGRVPEVPALGNLV